MSKLKISDQTSQVKREIEQAPGDSQIAEAIRNCLEAIGTDPGTIETFQISPSIFGDEFEMFNPKKLCIANTCPNGGLDAKNLNIATDLSSSINKANSVSENFGRGGKVTSLAANPKGFLWGSRVGDKKFLVWLRQDEDGEYERYDWYETLAESDTGFTDVLDITDVDLPFDYWEGDYNFNIFLGKEEKQDTVLNPYNDGNKTPAWLINTIYKRFWVWPSNVELRLNVGHSKGKSAKPKFTSLPNHLENLKSKGVRTEKIKVENRDIEITYVFDPDYSGQSADQNKNRTSSVVGAPMTAPPFGGIIYKGELHDVTDGNALKAVARSYGIPFGYKNLRAYVHLPTNPKEYEHDADRQYIRRKDSVLSHITQVDFSQLVRENKPDWFIEEQEKMTPTLGSNDLQERLQKIAENMTILQPSGGSKGDSKPGYYNGNSNKNPKPRSGPKKPANNLTKRSGKGPNLSTIDAPKIEHLRTNADVENCSADNIKNRAAQYDLETHTLYLNYTYPACYDLQQELVDDYINSPRIDDLEPEIQKLVEIAFGELIGTSVLLAYSKRVNKHWTYEDIITATSVHSLSIQGDNILQVENKIKLQKEAAKLVEQVESIEKLAA